MKLKRNILNMITVLALTLVPAATLAGTAYAAPCGHTDAAQKVLEGVGQTGNDCNDKPVDNAFATVVKILSIVTGVVAVIAIIYGGFKYITSGGDANKVGAAKNTVLYALVGLAVAGLAQILVHLVISTAANVK